MFQIMRKTRLFTLLCVLLSAGAFAQYTPVAVTGFNHDVIAEGTGNSSLTTTTSEMDALTPSNFVMCTSQFATFNSFPTGYGLPDNLLFTSGTSSYQVNTTGNNAVYLFPTQQGTLTLNTPATYSSISFLTLATENDARLDITFTFSDGTTYVSSNVLIEDWYKTAPTSNIVMSGRGRIKRKTGPFAAGDYNNLNSINGPAPAIYSVNISLPCGKTLSSISFKNVTFVFAVSGISAVPLVAPTLSPGFVCSYGSTTTLTVTNFISGATYRLYTAAFGGTPVSTSTTATITTPVVNANVTYYVDATSGGCTTARVPVTVTLSAAPVAPAATATSVCTGNTSTITIQSVVAGVTYRIYTTATGGTPIGTATATGTFTTPAVTATTTYYVEAVSAGGCVSAARTPVVVNQLLPLANPVVTATFIGANSVTFSWQAVTGAVSYEVSVNGGTFAAPSSGATGTTHTISGLTPGQTMNITVRAVATDACRNSTGTASAITVTDQVYVPNVFTPNGDGRNDVLYVYGNVIQTMQFQIFNQWGEKIFESSNKSVGWAGTVKSKPQPAGVYVYTLRVTTTNGQTIDRKGSITLVR
jgi:gliding motility-associated-like protein